MIEQNDIKMTNWLEEEAETIKQMSPPAGDKKPALKLVENKITTIDIDFSKPFNKWTGTTAKGKNVTKAIIPIKLGAVEHNWWLNVTNPIYKEIITRGSKGQKTFKIFQIGNQADTKYTLVED